MKKQPVKPSPEGQSPKAKKYAPTLLLNPGVEPEPSIPLLPCPFCGSDELYVGWTHALGVGVLCRSCRAKSRTFDLPEFSSKRNVPLRLCLDAAKAWNMRGGKLVRG